MTRARKKDPEPQKFDETMLIAFPPRTGATRSIYFDELDHEVEKVLRKRGYDPVIMMTLPRDTEEDHRNFLIALGQGMSERTIAPSKPRLEAAELDMRAHGMLNKYGPVDVGKSKRERDVHAILSDWTRGRHALAQSTVNDPRDVERYLKERAGIVERTEENRKKSKRRFKRKYKGAD